MFQILQNMSVWSMKSQVYLLWGDNMVLERGFDQVDLWFLSSDVCRCERRGPSVSKSWAGREGRKSRQKITERRGGSLERAFIFCHILVPADCLGVTGGWSQCSRSQRPPPTPPHPHTHTHIHTRPHSCPPSSVSHRCCQRRGWIEARTVLLHIISGLRASTSKVPTVIMMSPLWF